MLPVDRNAVVLIAGLLLFSCLSEASEVTPASTGRIAQLVFQNECAGQLACLTSWNEGEAFASLGIGHFIWYPQGVAEKDKHFSESFPELLRFMQQHGVDVPLWLLEGNPWPNRTTFEHEKISQNMEGLRQFLVKTMPFQADFLEKRLKNALPLMLSAVPKHQRMHIRQQFERVAAAPMGMYALMDYVNFKGEGINPKERYAGQGWGLMQVLMHMQGQAKGIAAIREFSRIAGELLDERVAHAPSGRDESRWLPGWHKRLASYVREAESLGGSEKLR